MPSTLKPKYLPDLLKVDLNNRRELLNEGVKGRNNICLFHKYPHLAPAIDSNPHIVTASSPKVVVSTDFSSLYEDPRDAMTPTDDRLLWELVNEFLRGPTVTPSVQKKVHAYLLHLCEGDRHFRQQCLGGVPHSDPLKFSGLLLAQVGRFLAPQFAGEKIFRLPVHKAVQQALVSMTYISCVLHFHVIC